MYLSSIFQHLQKANLSLQGKKKNVFVLNSRIESLKTKVEFWKTKAEQSDFSSFAELNEFLHACEWETLEPNLPEAVKKLVLAHLKFLSQRLFLYFPEKETADLLKNSWVLNPFSKADHVEESEKLINLRNDLEKKALFDSGNYESFWIKMLRDDPEYADLAERAVKLLTIMPSTWLSESGFSVLVEIKTKKRNRLGDDTFDAAMRAALEKEIEPNFERLCQVHQQQMSH